MRSRKPEAQDCAAEDTAAHALVEACSIEIAAQKVLLWVVVLPTAIVILPATVIALALYLTVHLIGAISTNLHWIGEWAEEHWWSQLVASGIISLAVGWVPSILSRNPSLVRGERRLRALTGQAGGALASIVSDLWQLLPRAAAQPPPTVMWFANFNVMASANDRSNFKEIHVSSALWERAIRRDPIAIGILAHEMAHLVFHDGPRLRSIEGFVATAHRALGAAKISVLLPAAMAGIAAVVNYTTLFDLVCYEVAVVAFAALVLLVPIFADVIVRRSAALITALIEIRADACAGLWTDGLAGFARSLSADSSVKPSSPADIRHSVLSPDLTHISNSERIALLSDTQRLATPKLRYFALSLALPFLLPLNPLTPLQGGGMLDYILVAAVVVVAHFTAIAMIVSGAPALSASVSWRTTSTLGAFLCVAIILPQVNLYQFGYLLSHLAAGLVSPGGFGTDALTWETMLSDIEISIIGLLDDFLKATGGGLIFVAMICSTVCLRVLSSRTRQIISVLPRKIPKSLWIGPASLASIATLASIYDKWRSPTFFPFNLAAVWFEATISMPWVRLCTPELVGVIIFALEIACLKVSASRARQVDL
ncbi:hypothetical protein P9273_24635 [Mesorhizobium sp. WSM4935]|uniref:hypothetical protein n=1 Tax=Mesorhizobium sp. WSM4935 TaxID=3038547 RepID=UPI002415675D|nr:hypothetical protein [Mesorhizobium sp. WSM4935]MDG4878266.1 hypothetical protein [Mesorhizobium sp. WSM4935]